MRVIPSVNARRLDILLQNLTANGPPDYFWITVYMFWPGFALSGVVSRKDCGSNSLYEAVFKFRRIRTEEQGLPGIAVVLSLPRALASIRAILEHVQSISILPEDARYSNIDDFHVDLNSNNA